MPVTDLLNTPSKLEAFMQKVLSDIQEQHPDFKHAEVKGGKFTAKEIVQVANQAPAIYLAWSNKKPIGTSTCKKCPSEITFSLAIVTADKRGLDRHTFLARAVESIEKQIKNNTWEIEGARSPKNLRSINEYNGGDNKTGIALASTHWQQQILL